MVILSGNRIEISTTGKMKTNLSVKIIK